MKRYATKVSKFLCLLNFAAGMEMAVAAPAIYPAKGRTAQQQSDQGECHA